MMTTTSQRNSFFHHGAFIVNGSFVLTIGYFAMLVKVAPNLTLTNTLAFKALENFEEKKNVAGDSKRVPG